MNNTEISRRLALAIGYEPDHVNAAWGAVRVWHNDHWQWFDHSDERTIFRIAARYKMFPQWWPSLMKFGIQRHELYVWHYCPATCIALAVIDAREKGMIS